MADHVLWFDDSESHRAEVAGGKGASLGRLRKAGLPVPPGFVVAAAAMSDSLAGHGALDEVAALAVSFDGGDDSARIAAEIQAIVSAAPLGEDLVEEVTSAYGALGQDVFVAVRSSACAEDGEAASFAGQQETFLNVVGSEEVLDRVVGCWASFFSERALFYRHRKGSLADLGMAVAVQRQIASDKSGVMFTTDPIRRRTDQMVIEAVFGLGEAVVSGMVTPDNYVVRRDGRLKKAQVGSQDKKVVRNENGGTMILDLDEDAASARVLDDVELARLASVGLQIEETLGSPQDIEWAFEDDELYVLQSRPITA
ncbi:MAG TPA: PEP/pyruvate-binding domain-containing protein [Acidimicrobiia bacterium]